MARLIGFEPITFGSEVHGSIQLSYKRLFNGVTNGARTRDTRIHKPVLYLLNYDHHKFYKLLLFLLNGVPEGTRTPDPRLRRALLYPSELQAR